MALSKNYYKYIDKFDSLFKEFKTANLSRKKKIAKILLLESLNVRKSSLLSIEEFAYFVTGLIPLFNDIGGNEEQFYTVKILQYSGTLELSPESDFLLTVKQEETQLIKNIEEYLNKF